MALKLECRDCVQMSSVDVYAVGGAGESDWWEEISRKALSLDRDDFLPSGYKVSAKFKAPASMPPWTRGGPRPSDRSQPSPAKKRKTALPQQAMNLVDDDVANNSNYRLSEEDEDDNKEEGRDDVLVENLDPKDFATPPPRPPINVPDSRPSTGTPSSSGTPGASSSMGRREKRKERDPMASVLELLTTMMAESQWKHDLQMAKLSARQEWERMENLRLHEESWQIQMENLQMMRQMQQITNMLLAAFMKMNLDILQALSAASPSPPLMIGSVASGSLLSGSSTREAEAAQLLEEEANDPIPPAMAVVAYRRTVRGHRQCTHLPPKVTRPETASVVPESPGNLEIDALEIGGGSDELGFEVAAVGSDT